MKMEKTLHWGVFVNEIGECHFPQKEETPSCFLSLSHTHIFALKCPSIKLTTAQEENVVVVVAIAFQRALPPCVLISFFSFLFFFSLCLCL